MAFGTETVPAVYKIFGPGNQYVTKAKELIQQQGVAIDMPAGPSEVLVIADSTCNPSFVASDLLSQAEHGADSQVILVSDDANVSDFSNTSQSEELVNIFFIGVKMDARDQHRAVIPLSFLLLSLSILQTLRKGNRLLSLNSGCLITA